MSVYHVDAGLPLMKGRWSCHRHIHHVSQGSSWRMSVCRVDAGLPLMKGITLVTGVSTTWVRGPNGTCLCIVLTLVYLWWKESVLSQAYPPRESGVLMAHVCVSCWHWSTFDQSCHRHIHHVSRGPNGTCLCIVLMLVYLWSVLSQAYPPRESGS